MKVFRKALVWGALLVGHGVFAQGTPVHLLVGFPAGGGTDAIARTLADKLKDHLGVPVLVETRPALAARSRRRR